jgi:hypothetical protein
MADMVSACSLRDLKGENQVLFKIPEPIVGGMLMETKNVNEYPELSLMVGGPGDALMKRLRLIRPEFGAASARTAISLAALTWLPLLVFSSIEGLALGGARIPFLYDLAAHARFLVAVPILVLAEIPIGRRLRKVAKRFLDAGLVRDEERKRFASCVVDIVWFRDWRPAELTVCALAYITTYAAISNTSLQSGSTWFEPSSAVGLSPVGYYYALVSLPIFQFLMYRLGIPNGRVDEISMAGLETRSFPYADPPRWRWRSGIRGKGFDSFRIHHVRVELGGLGGNRQPDHFQRRQFGRVRVNLRDINPAATHSLLRARDGVCAQAVPSQTGRFKSVRDPRHEVYAAVRQQVGGWH